MFVLVGARNVYADVMYTVYNTLNRQVEEVNERNLKDMLLDYMFSNLTIVDGNIVGVHCEVSTYLKYQRFNVYTLFRKVKNKLLLIDRFGNRVNMEENDFVQEYGKSILCPNVFKRDTGYDYPHRVKVTEKADTRKRPTRDSMKLTLTNLYIGRLQRSADVEEDDWWNEEESLESSFVLMCDKVYSSYFGHEVSIKKMHEWYRASGDVYFDGLADTVSLKLLDGLGSAIGVGKELCDKILGALEAEDINFMMQPYDNSGRFFILPLGLDSSVVEELEKLLKSS